MTSVFGYDRFNTKIKNLNYNTFFRFMSWDYLKPTFNMNVIKTALFLVGESSSRSFLFNSLKTFGGLHNQKSSSFYQKKFRLNKNKETAVNKWLQYDPTFIRLQKIKPFYTHMPHW